MASWGWRFQGTRIGAPIGALVGAFVCTLIGVTGAAGAAAQTLHKCQDAQGRVIYTDRPCAAQAAAPASAPWQRPAPVAVPPLRPAPDLSALPKDAQGRAVIASSPQGALVLDKGPRGPLQLLAACSALVSGCVKPPERSLDACMASAPRCTGPQAWKAEPFVPCCPSVCAARYEAERRRGTPPLQALDRTLYGGDWQGSPCIPLR